MTPLELLRAGTGAARAPRQPLPELHVSFQDTLAAGQRLWMRGRLGEAVATPNGQAESRWWKLWRKDGPVEPSTIHLETRVSGHILEAELPVQAAGSFEALLTAPLPPARRGWRVARN